MENNSRVYSSKEERISIEKRNAELVNLVLDFVIENGMSAQEIDTCIDKVREAFYSDGVISRESNEKTAQEGPVQEQLKVTIQPKDRDLLDCKIDNIKLLAIKISHELESLPNMYEFKI